MRLPSMGWWTIGKLPVAPANLLGRICFAPAALQRLFGLPPNVATRRSSAGDGGGDHEFFFAADAFFDPSLAPQVPRLPPSRQPSEGAFSVRADRLLRRLAVHAVVVASKPEEAIGGEDDEDGEQGEGDEETKSEKNDASDLGAERQRGAWASPPATLLVLPPAQVALERRREAGESSEGAESAVTVSFATAVVAGEEVMLEVRSTSDFGDGGLDGGGSGAATNDGLGAKTVSRRVRAHRFGPFTVPRTGGEICIGTVHFEA